ncbi:hypothetical protein FACS1894116_12900 [Betaproteobacteria bacterium]|nr:hypothetical protein FACS1894116_12900 [Betaproteobacteria bacterium]GHU30860.1 hypothetical protein FACS189497_11090 [Betaproteobacteria bacterium]
MQASKQANRPRLSSLALLLTLAFPLPAFAQTPSITINSDLGSLTVYGNGAPPNNSTPPTTAIADNYSILINSGGTVNYAFGGEANTANNASATNNSVTLNGGTVNNDVRGGRASVTATGNYTSSATGNTVTINGGEVGNVYGGEAINGGTGTATATNNTVIIEGSPTINGWILGGRTNAPTGTAGDAFTGNTLQLNSAANIARVLNFETVKFGNIGTAGVTTLDTTPTGVTSGNPLVKLDTQGNTITFGGVINGTGGIDKQSAGTLTLTGNNTYSGNTWVSYGRLTVTGTLSRQSRNVRYLGKIEMSAFCRGEGKRWRA